jgi:hypothetical protein
VRLLLVRVQEQPGTARVLVGVDQRLEEDVGWWSVQRASVGCPHHQPEITRPSVEAHRLSAPCRGPPEALACG